MAKAKKLPSGNWRVQLYAGKDANGKRIYRSFTAPTRKEAEYLAADYALTLKQQKRDLAPTRITLDAAMARWIENRRNALSPSTSRMYDSMYRNAYTPLLSMPVIFITAEDVQATISAYAATHSPKSVRNAYGLLHSVLTDCAPSLDLSRIKLPQRVLTELEIPQDDDVARLIAYSRDHDQDLYIAVLLAATLGLRRSEICALTQEDFTDGKVSINKALVLSYDNCSHVVKPPKTASGYRTLDVEPEIYAIVKAHGADPRTGRILSLSPEGVSARYATMKKQLNIPGRFHDLRHYAASVMLALGVPNKYAMRRMGHSTPQMTERVYQHVFGSVDEQFTHSIDAHTATLLRR